MFKSTLSGTIAGTVTDTAGFGLEDISIYAVTGSDTIATLTGETGDYKLILLGDTYIISSAGYDVSADTTYHAVELNVDDHLTGFDFIME